MLTLCAAPAKVSVCAVMPVNQCAQSELTRAAAAVWMFVYIAMPAASHDWSALMLLPAQTVLSASMLLRALTVLSVSAELGMLDAVWSGSTLAAAAGQASVTAVTSAASYKAQSAFAV